MRGNNSALKSRKYITFIVYVVVAAMVIQGGWKLTSRISKYYDDKSEYLYRNQKLFELPLETYVLEEENAWYNMYSIIAHSGGGIDGKIYTNSLESWNYSYDNGTRVFDADISLTSDNVLVLRHEWHDEFEQANISEDNIPDFSEFMDTPIHNIYTPMSVYDMLNFMEEHNDCYVACDFKDGTAGIKEFVSLVKDGSMEHLLKRIIISFYDYKDYFQIKNIYNFDNWAIRQYENSPHNYYELTLFCVENNIPVCMVKEKYLQEGDDISILLDKGIHVWVAVVNDIKDIKSYWNRGVSGFVSDFIHEEEMLGIK